MEVLMIIIYLGLPTVHHFADREIGGTMKEKERRRGLLYFLSAVVWLLTTHLLGKVMTDQRMWRELVAISGVSWIITGFFSLRNTRRGN